MPLIVTKLVNLVIDSNALKTLHRSLKVNMTASMVHRDIALVFDSFLMVLVIGIFGCSSFRYEHKRLISSYTENVI